MNMKQRIGIAAMVLSAVMSTADADTQANKNAELFRVDNKTASKLEVTTRGTTHEVSAGKTLELPLDGQDVTVEAATNDESTSKFTVSFNPGTCVQKVCVTVHK
ncbi:hypothetical protein SB759_09150 [Pseudomonas sp. SIMBA_059]